MFEWGERDDQAVVVHELAGDAGLRHAEIDLRDAGRPDELAVSVGTAPVRLAPASHVPRRRRVLAVVLGLRAEPVVHAFGGVALLAGQHAVGLEPSVDQRRVRVDLGAAAPVRGRFRRHVVHVGVFRDSGAVHVRPPRDLRPGHSLTVQSPDILLFGHRYRHRPFLPERRRLQPADSFLGCVSGIYRHGGLVPVFVWAVIWCSFRWKPAAYAAEKQCRNCLRKIEAKHSDGDSALMLVYARIRYVTANEWSTRRYLDMSRLDDNLVEAN